MCAATFSTEIFGNWVYLADLWGSYMLPFEGLGPHIHSPHRRGHRALPPVGIGLTGRLPGSFGARPCLVSIPASKTRETQLGSSSNNDGDPKGR